MRCSFNQFTYLCKYLCLGGAGGDGGKGQIGKSNLDKVPNRPANGNAKEVYERGIPDSNHPEDHFFQSKDCCCLDGACYDGLRCHTVVEY